MKRGGSNPAVKQAQRQKPTAPELDKTYRQFTAEEERILRYYIEDAPASQRAIATKLVHENAYTQSHTKGSMVPLQVSQRVASRLMTTIGNTRAIKKNIPELELIQEILTSCIMSPHDLVSEELSWSVDGRLPQSISSVMLGIIQDHFTSYDKLVDKVPKIIQNALFDRGSHILAVLPESAIDDIIHHRSSSSLESFKEELKNTFDFKHGQFKSIGLLGEGLLLKQQQPKQSQSKLNQFFNPSFASLESYQQYNQHPVGEIIPDLLYITDNLDLLKSPKLFTALAKRRIRENSSIYSNESVMFDPKVDDDDFKQTPVELLYKDPGKINNVHTITTVNDRHHATRKSIGHPLVLELPHESCIPVFSPGNPEDHLGYLILLDRTGNPLSYDVMMTAQRGFDASAQMTGGQSVMSQVGNIPTIMSQTLNNLGTAMGAGTCNFGQVEYQEMYSFSVRVIERDLKTRFNNGIYGENVDIGRVDEVYHIMLSRMLAGTLTQLLYIPSSLVTYFAFYYNELGIGESLITRNEIKCAMKITTQYANNMANIRNAIGRRTLNIELDELDESADETVAKLINRYTEANSMTTLYHTFDPSKIEQQLYRSSIDIKVTGNETMETTNVDVEYKSPERPKIDTDFIEVTDNDFYNGMGIPSDLITEATSNNFAAEWASKYVLFMNRTRKKAVRLNNFLADYVKKYVLHDGSLIKDLSDVIREYKNELTEEQLQLCREQNSTIPVIEDFLEGLAVGVPLPTGDTVENIMKAWKAEKERIDELVPIMLDQDSIETMIREEDPEVKKEVMGKVEDKFKVYFYCKWIRENNAFPVFDELVQNPDTDNEELFKQLFSPMERLSDVLGNVVQEIASRRNPDGDGEGSSGDTGSTDDTTTTTPSDPDDDTFENPDENKDENPDDTSEDDDNKDDDDDDNKEDDTNDETNDETGDTGDIQTDDLDSEAAELAK